MYYYSFLFNNSGLIELSNNHICGMITYDLTHDSVRKNMSIDSKYAFLLLYLNNHDSYLADYIEVIDYKTTIDNHIIASFKLDTTKILHDFRQELIKSPIKTKLILLLSDLADEYDINTIISDMLEELYDLIINQLEISVYGLIIDKYRFEHRPNIDKLEQILYEKETSILEIIYNELEPYITTSKTFNINDDLYQQYKNYDLYTRNKEIEMHIQALVDIIKKSKNPIDTKNSIIDDIKYKCIDL